MLLLKHFLFFFLPFVALLANKLFLIVIVTRMFFLELFAFEVEVVDLVVTGFARFPIAGEWRLESFLRDIEKMLVFAHVHSQILGVFFDLLICRFII